MRGSAADQTRISTISLTEFVFYGGAIFITNDKDGAFSTYYTGNLRLDHVFGRLWFQLSAKFLDTLVYFGLYKFALRMETDPVLTALTFMGCMEVDWDKKAAKDGSVSYDFQNEKVLGLEEESAQVGMRARSNGGSSTTVTLAAVPVFFRAVLGRLDISEVRQNYDAYCGLDLNPKPASGVDLDTLFDQDFCRPKLGIPSNYRRRARMLPGRW